MSLSPEETEMIKKLSESGKFVITPKESEAPIAGAGFKTSTPFKQAEASRNDLYEFENRVHDSQMVKGHLNVPKIQQFSGEDPPLKGDVSFREWRFEIQYLKNDPDITESILGQAIRRSLKGTARRMFVPLGEWATIGEILDKLDTLFGDISTNGMIMQEFFNACQKADESVTVFGCRLETMLQVAIDNGYLARSAKSELLRHKFWTSLASEKLKSQTRRKYDTLRDYDELLREIRRVKKEININTDASGSASVTGTGSSLEDDSKIRNGAIDLIYGSPEAFVGDSVWRASIQKLNVSAIVVDEFHTIATWGDDDDDGTQKQAFRKWFASVGELRSLFPSATVLALSATCTVKIKKRVMKVLQMKDDTVEIIKSPNKSNIKLSAFKVPNTVEMSMYWLVEGLYSRREHFPRTILYCVSIKDVSKIYSYLINEMPECASLVEMFHSETPEVKKDKIIKELKQEGGSSLRLVISSSALGMGIDVKDCQSVVLFGPPTNLVDLIQQVGRIGRDKRSSVALVLYNSYHLRQTGSEVRSVLKTDDCRRLQLLGHFLNPKDLTDVKNKETGLHTCCDLCTVKCSCGECEPLLLEKLFSCTQSEPGIDSDGDTESYDLSDYEFEEELLMADTAYD